MSRTRISVTIPPQLVAAADRRARALQRSRSWVVTEAVRQYLEEGPALRQRRTEGSAVREAAPQWGEGGGPGADPRGLGAYRRAQLEADLALTPEQRVREAEETARVDDCSSPRVWRAHRLLMFDDYEDYLAWERWAEIRPR